MITLHRAAHGRAPSRLTKSRTRQMISNQSVVGLYLMGLKMQFKSYLGPTEEPYGPNPTNNHNGANRWNKPSKPLSSRRFFQIGGNLGPQHRATGEVAGIAGALDVFPLAQGRRR